MLRIHSEPIALDHFTELEKWIRLSSTERQHCEHDGEITGILETLKTAAEQRKAWQQV